MPELESVLFDQAPVAMLYFDAQLQLTAMNQAAAQLWGGLGDLLLHKPASRPFLPGVEAQALQEALAGTASQFDASTNRGDGTLQQLKISYTPIALGEQRGVLVTASDITAEHTLAEELRQSRDTLIAVFENLPASVVAMKASGEVILRNRANRELRRQIAPIRNEKGEQAAEFPGDYHHNGQPMLITDYPRYRAVRGEEVRGAALYYLDHGGSRHWVSVNASPVRDDNHQVQLAVSIARDTTHEHELEAELRASRDELVAVLDNIPAALSLVEPDGRVRYINPTGRKLLGLGADSDLGHIEDYRGIIQYDITGKVLAWQDNPTVRALRGEVFSDALTYLTTPDGHNNASAVTGASVKDAEGNVRLAITIVRDVTRQHELEAELRASRDELRAVLDNMTDGVWLVGASGEVVYRNAASDRLLGVQDGTPPLGAEVASQVVIRYFDGTPVPENENPLYRTMQGETFTNEEVSFTALDGRERIISMSGSSLRGDDGKVRLAISVARDVSRERAAEAQIVQLLDEAQAERQRLLQILEQMQSGVIITAAPDNRLVLMNRVAAEIYGLDPDLIPRSSTLSLSHYEMLTPSGQPLAIAARPLVRAMAGEVVRGVPMQVRSSDGTERDLLVSAAPIFEEAMGESRITGAVSVFQDISALAQLDRLKDEFISITSHELLTPLTTIKWQAQLTMKRLRRLSDVALRTELEKSVQAISGRAERMVQMVNDLLDSSRIAVGRLEARSHPLDLGSLTVSLASELGSSLERKITLTLPDEPTIVLAEERLVEQVLSNLIGNAVKYSPAGGRVHIAVSSEAGSAMVAVSDQGIGLAPGSEAQLFSRFYRTEEAKDSARGLGLGLYISAGLIAAMGGRIWAASAGIGKGATFSFSLPLAG